jgi:hypothetical protein
MTGNSMEWHLYIHVDDWGVVSGIVLSTLNVIMIMYEKYLAELE